MKKFLLGLAGVLLAGSFFNLEVKAYDEVGEFGRPGYIIEDTAEQIAEEITEGEMELLAQLVEAEAGNQDLEGKRLVASVVLNRVRDERFPNTVEDVIFQNNQFSVVKNGAWERAAYNMQQSDYDAVWLEYQDQINTEVLYFNNSPEVYGSGTPFKHGGHYFNS